MFEASMNMLARRDEPSENYKSDWRVAEGRNKKIMKGKRKNSLKTLVFFCFIAPDNRSEEDEEDEEKESDSSGVHPPLRRADSEELLRDQFNKGKQKSSYDERTRLLTICPRFSSRFLWHLGGVGSSHNSCNLVPSVQRGYYIARSL